MTGGSLNNVRVSAHFTLREFECRCCGCVKLDARLLAMLEELRAAWGRPLLLTSGYRCPRHNAAVGGAPRSLHMAGRAADVRVPFAEQDDFQKCARTVDFTEIIVGKKKNYVHVACCL